MATTLAATGTGAEQPAPADIGPGKRGSAVAALQSQLGIAPDGIDGPETTSVLKRFQQKNGLTPDGIAGPQTRAAFAVTPTVSEGSYGDRVRAVQQRLHVPVDGIDGPQTTSAIERYQNAHGLIADGIVGAHTWQSLVRETPELAVAAGTVMPPPRVTPTPTVTATPTPVATATPAAPAMPATAAALKTKPALAPGSKQHDAVKKLQHRLGVGSADGVYGAGTAAFVRAFQADHGLKPTGSMDAATWKKLGEVGDASNVSRTANASGHYSRLGVLQAMGSRYDDPGSDRADLSDPSMTPQKTIDMLGNLIHNTYDGKPGFTISAVRSDHHDDGPTLHAGGLAVDMYPNDDSGLATLLGGIDANPYVTNVGLGGDYDTSGNKALITNSASHYVFDDNGQTHVHVGDGNYPGK